MNWQHCHTMAFVGLNDSYEQMYQAIRRCYRFGQTKPVQVHLISADCEGAVLKNIKRKEVQHVEMSEAMLEHMREFSRKSIQNSARQTDAYDRNHKRGPDWEMVLGDCVDVAREMESASAGYSIFSIPFASLFTYTNSIRDMGNSRTADEFWTHYGYLAREMLRVMKPGRLVSIHCMNLIKTKVMSGVIGLTDFRGELTRVMQNSGFIYHSEVTIWKDPVVQMQRTKAIGLLYKQLRKDAYLSRQGLADYVVTFRTPGVNAEPITHDQETLPLLLWQHLASPVWDDIVQGNTLNRKMAREEDDQRHICPLQLDLIERCLFLWSNPGDLVYSPFAGIGSEGYVATAMGRRFIGSELKRSYFDLACQNLQDAPRGDYRFPRFQSKVGKWEPGAVYQSHSQPRPEADPAQLDWLALCSGARAEGEEGACGSV